MALPKEPRQKMINMMYLVLTALLALNVSSEILNAFKTVNNSISTSNAIIDGKNAVTYKNFEKELSDPQTKAKAEVWKPKADEVKRLSAELYGYIEELKLELKKESDLRIEDGVESFKEDNLDAATRLMDKKGKGKELYDRLAKYRNEVLSVLNPDEFKDNPLFQEQLKQQLELFQKSIPIDLNVPKGQSGKSYSNDAAGWTTNYFHMTPTIAGLTILSKFQNDVRSTEAQLVDYCHDQIGSVKVVYDEFAAIAQSNTSYAMPGDALEITAGVGAFSEAAKPRITINGQSVALTGGKAVYKTTAGGSPGQHSVAVRIEYTKPDGSIAVKDELVKYTVGVPSGASIFLEKMNVLYIGVDNPLTISGGSVGAEKVQVSFPNGSLSKIGGDRYIAKPTGNPGLSKIIVVSDGSKTEFPMRIKNLPPPTGFVGQKKGGSMSAAEFKAMGAVLAKLEDADFEAPFKVLSYQLSAVGGPIPQYLTQPNKGNRWDGQPAGDLVARSGPGTRIFIDNISVIGPDGKPREISPMQFNLK